MPNISVTQLLILLAIVVLVFGTKRLRNIGGDLGSAIRGFRKGLKEEDDAEAPKLEADPEAPDAKRSSTKQEPAKQD